MSQLRYANLPMVGPTGTGSHSKCQWACGDDCFKEVPNHSANETFADVVARTVSRRSLLKGGLGAAIVVSGVLSSTERVLAAPGTNAADGRNGSETLGFTPIAPSTADDVEVPEGYDWDIIASWGDPIIAGAPAFDFHSQTASKQALQFGYNCDWTALFPPRRNGPRTEAGLLWVNHEYTDPGLMFPDYVEGAPTKEQVDIELAAHGGSVLKVNRERGQSSALLPRPQARLNRRITATTPMALTGPAAGSSLLRTGEDATGRQVLGTLNNCGGGATPWGTVLTAEENFNQYFANAPATPEYERYGLVAGPSVRRWENYYDRFDLAKEPNEAHRFGWIVEVDPYDPDSKPRKRTALGRMKHEGAETSLTPDGRVVIYMGDDERFDYLYKFVSDRRFRKGDNAHNRTLLDSGTLSVARFDDAPGEPMDSVGDTFAGEWIPLVSGTTSHVPGMSTDEVLVFTRLAADQVGATKMDRPEDVQRNPRNGSWYLMLTNNTLRTESQEDASNPRGPNTFGHVIEMRDRGNDGAATRFFWRIFLLCGHPEDPETYFAGYDKSRVSPIGAPDNVVFDRLGNMWIATDGQPSTIFKNDALHAVPVAGPQRGRVQQFLSVPRGAECTGPYFSEDNSTLVVSVQHPGEGGSLEVPLSTWPDRDDNPARPSVISVWRAARGERRVGA
ncbi:PhoX family protein [soil metagenome]